MPPTAGARKTQPQTQPHAHTAATAADGSRRQSGRQPRASIARPPNYYARPFASSFSAPDLDPSSSDHRYPPGFFPAIQHFTDAISALPREVMRHFTLLNEVEAKLYAPSQTMTGLVDAINAMPMPPRRSRQPSRQVLLSFTANNSTAASANGSVNNGSVPALSQQPSHANENLNDVPATDPQLDSWTDMARRRHFHYLRTLIQSILGNLDERNVCLTEANRTLDRQLSRLDSILPRVEDEISPSARLGSMDHWAYSDNRLKKSAANADKSVRRDIAATNSLAAAAASVHESDIAAVRAEARRETKKRAQADSELDDRSLGNLANIKKQHPKARNKVEDISKQLNGHNPQALKRRKVEPVPAMERSASTGTARAPKGPSRSTPLTEVNVKKKKSAPAPLPALMKKRALQSPIPSPDIVSSLAAPPDDLNSRRPSSARTKRKSPSPEKAAADAAVSRRPSIAGKPTSQEGSVKSNTSRKSSTAATNGQYAKTASADTARDGDTTTQKAPKMPGDEDIAALDVQPADGYDSDADDGGRHDRSRSRHILKQIASFNRSPVLGHREPVSDGQSRSNDEEAQSGEESRGRQPRSTRSIPRSAMELEHSEAPGEQVSSTPPLVADQVNEPDQAPQPQPQPRHEEAQDLSRSRQQSPQEDDEEGQSGDHEPVHTEPVEDDGEQDQEYDWESKYCYCNKGSYGTMIACENPKCEREWFHLECTGLKAVPNESVKWFCDVCDPKQRKRRNMNGS